MNPRLTDSCDDPGFTLASKNLIALYLYIIVPNGVRYWRWLSKATSAWSSARFALPSYFPTVTFEYLSRSFGYYGGAPASG
jgi:hypothetical protein